MRLRPILALVLLGSAPARTSLGQFGRWGAFRENGRCFAVAQPLGRGGGSLAVTSGAGVRAQLHLALPRAGAATLRVGDRLFPLLVRGSDAWGSSDRDDLRVLAALRKGEVAEVRVGGSRARYPLAGFASALDAALVGCAALEK